MAPSTVAPTNLHRAPVACVSCRTAKVRCLVSQDPRRCDRCINHDHECVFVRPRRTKNRGTAGGSAGSSAANDGPRVGNDTSTEEGTRASVHASRSAPRDATSHRPLDPADIEANILTPSTHRARGSSPEDPFTGSGHPVGDDRPAYCRGQAAPCDETPAITNEIRSRIIGALSSLEGKKGPPFSFVTSGAAPSTTTNAAGTGVDAFPSRSHAPDRDSTLRLSSILRPLRSSPGDSSRGGEGDVGSRLPTSGMPSYLDSISLGHLNTDPIEGKVIDLEASRALFEHFMEHMNVKWEYILDPYVDGHDDVRVRSRFLFSTVLFCSSRFVRHTESGLVLGTDQFVQSRLCSVARNMAVRSFAQGDRSVEAMQAFYLLACWKEPDDDISYLHSGYAFRTLQDLSLEQGEDAKDEEARRKRTWLALFRQDKQQSLFFMRDSRTSHTDDSMLDSVSDPRVWRTILLGLPADLTACCNAELRKIQSRMHGLIRKASPPMLSCLLDLLDSELGKWRAAWQVALDWGWTARQADNVNVKPSMLHPGKAHVESLMGLWECSVRLNVSSAIFRQELTAAVKSALEPTEGQQEQRFLPTQLDLPVVTAALATDMVGLGSSIEGAFGTLRNLLSIPAVDLRRSPDSVLLLGPMTALFLCLVLCLPCNGIIGPSFQRKAIGLVRQVCSHYESLVLSTHDSATLHADYLQALVDLLTPRSSEGTAEAIDEIMRLSATAGPLEGFGAGLDCSTLQAAQVLAGRMDVRGDAWLYSGEAENGTIGDPARMLDLQSLENLLEPGYF